MRVLALVGKSDLPEAHLIAGLAQRGLAIRVLADPASPHLAVWRDVGLQVDPLVIDSRKSPTARSTIRAALRDFDPDLVHAFNNQTLACVLPEMEGNRARLVAYRGTTGHLGFWDFSTRRSFLSKRVDAISCVADAVRLYLLERGVPAEKLATIPKGHDPAWYASGAPSRSELGLDTDAVVIGCVANMRRVKGVPLLLKAVAGLQTDVRFQVALVGEVRDREVRAWRDRADLRGRLVFTGYRAAAHRLCRAFDLFVMPSLDREGLPKAVVEAMIQGVPAVVSDAGGLPEIVENDVSGLVVPAGSVEPLRLALKRMVEDAELRKRLAEGARARIASKFSVANTVELTLQLYERCVAR